jgi:hypothetical protein
MATAATGRAVTGWQYDNASGYYYDVQSQVRVLKLPGIGFNPKRLRFRV